jgi:polygalacturonase
MRKFWKSCLCIALSLIISHVVQAKEYNILDFGAKSDTTVVCTKAIQEAIDACNANGGGRVIIPAGNFVTGTIILKSFVELYLENGATLLGSKNILDYPDIKPDYISLRTQGTTRQLIYAENASHIAISGLGEIDGQGKYFKIMQPNAEGVLRPHLIRFISCQDIVVQNVSLRNSGAWMEHYLACERLQIKGVKIYNHCKINHHNNDGIDLDGCKNVTVSDVICDSDDDAITLKSTSPKACENITITNCVVSSHCNAIKMGTETTGGFKNITISNCIIKPSEYNDGDISGVKTGITGISLEIVDGGTMDGICISNVRIEGTHSPLFIRLANRARPYKEGLEVTQVGIIKNVSINNVFITSDEKIGCSITGIPGHPVENIHLSNIYFQSEGGGLKEDVYREVPEKEKDYPEGTMFGVLPAYGFYIRHAQNISVTGGETNTANPDSRPAFYLDDVVNGKLANLTLCGNESSEASVWLNQSEKITIQECTLQGTLPCFVRVDGAETRSVSVNGNILMGTKKLIYTNKVLNKLIRECGNIY